VVLHDDVPPDAPPDQLDSLVQRDAVLEALARLGHRAEAVAFGPGLADLQRDEPDVVFNLIESPGGDGRLAHLGPAWLESQRIPFTGSGAAAVALTTDKWLTKLALAARGVPVPADWPAGGPRYIVKSRFEEASVGLADDCVVHAHELPLAADRLRDRLGGSVVIETFVDGRELNLSLLETAEGWRALPPAEIRFVDFEPGKPKIVGYAAKWHEDSPEYRNTPRSFEVEGVDLDRVRAVAISACRGLGLGGHVRVDLRLTPAGEPVVMELNANPCLSPDAGYLAAAARAGLSLDDVVEALIEGALRRARSTLVASH
jgi:D-alanine-D-alanine ligase